MLQKLLLKSIADLAAAHGDEPVTVEQIAVLFPWCEVRLDYDSSQLELIYQYEVGTAKGTARFNFDTIEEVLRRCKKRVWGNEKGNRKGLNFGSAMLQKEYGKTPEGLRSNYHL